MGPVTLLIWHRNDVEGAVRLVSAAAPHVAEVVVIDSSDPETHRVLVERLRFPRARVVRALPLGNVEPLRPFGVHQVRTPFVFTPDCDEIPSSSLLMHIAGLPERDAYYVARHESSIDAYSWALRLYRVDRVRFQGFIHEPPSIRGTVGYLEPPNGLEHLADYRRYLQVTPRGREYLLVEAYERPTAPVHLREEFSGPFSSWLLGQASDRPITSTTERVVALGLRFRRYNPLNSVSGHYRTGKYLGRYLRARAQYFRGLPLADQQEALRIHHALHEAGGVIPYLGLEDPDYVVRLTSSFPWSHSGSEVLRDLLRFRFRSGRVRASWDQPLPSRSGALGE